MIHHMHHILSFFGPLCDKMLFLTLFRVLFCSKEWAGIYFFRCQKWQKSTYFWTILLPLFSSYPCTYTGYLERSSSFEGGIIAIVPAEGDPAKGDIIKHETIEEVYNNIILGLKLSSLPDLCLGSIAALAAIEAYDYDSTVLHNRMASHTIMIIIVCLAIRLCSTEIHNRMAGDWREIQI